MTEVDRHGHPVERIRPERPPQPDPLTADEVGHIVDLVVAYTRREPDTTMVQVWAAQSRIGRWTAAEAVDAIHRWGSTRGPSDFLEPSDVTRTIRADRADRAKRAEAERLMRVPELPPASRSRMNELIEQLSRRLGWSDELADGDGREGRRAVLGVACPACEARPLERCTRQGRGRRVELSGVHPARRAAVSS